MPPQGSEGVDEDALGGVGDGPAVALVADEAVEVDVVTVHPLSVTASAIVAVSVASVVVRCCMVSPVVPWPVAAPRSGPAVPDGSRRDGARTPSGPNPVAHRRLDVRPGCREGALSRWASSLDDRLLNPYGSEHPVLPRTVRDRMRTPRQTTPLIGTGS